MEFTNKTFATICRDKTICHKHAGVIGLKHTGVVERGSHFVQEGGMAACLEAPRLLPENLPDLDRFKVEATIYMNHCLNVTKATADAGYLSPYEANLGRLPPANTLAFMQPGFRHVHRGNKSEPKAERSRSTVAPQTCFYQNRPF